MGFWATALKMTKPANRPHPERPSGLLASLAFLLLLLFALPVIALLVRATQSDLLGGVLNDTGLQALQLSLTASTIVALLALLLGTPLAYGLARWEFRGKGLALLLVDLPIVLPPSVAGLALLMAFGRRGLWGGGLETFGISLPFTFAAVLLAQLFVAGPLYVRAARIGFQGLDPQLEEAARTEGANDWQMFRYVMLPEIGQAMVGGLALCWARALGEFGATILFAGNLPGRTQTMPLAIYLALESQPETALALAVLLLGISAAALLLLRGLGENQTRA